MLLLAASLGAPALAAQQDAVLNAEKVWAIDVDHGACALTRRLDYGSLFLFRAEGGAVTFGLISRKEIRTGRTGRLELGALSFAFTPSFSEEKTSLFYDGDFDPEVVAALRSANMLRILVDGQPVMAMSLEGTGFHQAYDGVVACSRGEAGWWGEGADAEAAEPPAPGPGFVMNKENVWALVVSKAPGVCIAQGTVDDHLVMQVLAANGERGFAIGSEERMQGGKRGRIETDAGSFEFAVNLDGKGLYLSSDGPFASTELALLQSAKSIRFSLDGRLLFDIEVDDTGFAAVLEDVAACSKGASGWWGKGALSPR